MRKFTESDIFEKMNTGNAIINQLQQAIKAIDDSKIINDRITDALNSMNRAYRDGLTTKVIEAVVKGDIRVLYLPPDKQFPAHIPFVRGKWAGRDCVLVNMTKYCVVERSETGEIESIKVDISKLYAMLVPAYMALKVINEGTVLSSETTKTLALLWAKMFNKILMSQKIFVGNRERYEAFMYFAMRFFMVYYLGVPMAIVDNLSTEYIGGVKSNYILTIENNLQHKGVDLYADWNTFARTMFSNEITNIKAVSNVDMNVEQYLRLFATYMGRDGSYLALWSADYAFFCFFVTWCHTWILNDRSFADIVDADPKLMPKILRGLQKEI